MMASSATKLVILFLAFCHPSLAEPVVEEIHVDEAEGEDGSKCITGGFEFPCKTLLYVADSIDVNQSSSLTIKIEGPTLHINSTVSFDSTTNLTLEGSPTELECNCENCGLIFNNSEGITIGHLSLNGCGVVSWWSTETLAAMFIYDCYNVVIESSNFTRSVNATGLYVGNTFGDVQILNCVFQNNTACNDCSSISGLKIRFLSSYGSGHETAGSASNYTIAHCHFRNNNNEGSLSFHSTSLGGGVELQIEENSTGNLVSFVDVCIGNNAASWGGGMAIEFGGNAQNNHVLLSQVTFRSNVAAKAGGGFDVGFIKGTSDPPITNTVYVKDCEFIDNTAKYGAGTAIYASHTNCAKESSDNGSTLVFESCRWAGNIATFFGSTVDISPYSYDSLERIYYPHPRFVDCVFTANHTHEQSNQTLLINVGSFAVNAFEVLFEGTVLFQNHSITPLHVTDGTVTFLPGTRALFENNSGSQGGALALFGSSVLQVLRNTTLSFINNSASGDGGAIYQSTQNHHDFFSTRTCFIQNGSEVYRDAKERPTLYFKGNSVGHTSQTGQAIYATTFLPCYFAQFSRVRFSKDGVMKALQKIALFYFDDDTVALATSPQAFGSNEINLSVIPGRVAQINITMKDELNQPAPTVYRVIRNDTCPADREFIINRFSVKSSEEGEQCTLSLVSVNFRESLLKLNITLEKCPPGFYMDNTSRACFCSAYVKTEAYFGINSCHDQQGNAYLSNNFWAGYDAQSLLTARCPSSFCIIKLGRDLHGIMLPNTSSVADLQKAVCRPNRADWLCGRCKDRHTTYFHSPTYQCRPQRYCAWGVLFYFISEVFPIVAMFSVIAVFDIRFTTGTASGLVFFAQVIDTVTIRMKWDSDQPKLIETLSIIYRVIYGLFNFNFFNLEPASFCLLRNATVQDVIAFKYISVLFAFVLLLCIVLFLKYCTCNNCLKTKRKVFAVGKNRSVIHSMSAVLVMCYAQCTNISFQILTKATLRGAGNEPVHTVTLYGGVEYFSSDHRVYALAACFCLSTIVAIPPVLLLVYPGYLTLFSFCKLSESYPVQFASRFFIKLKPFFDSFQGCYRDKLRFFSGVYFLGRVTILGIDAFVTSTSQSVLGMEITILIVLGMYALCHPFRSTTDNVNTILILVNISLIGVLTQLAYSQDRYEDQRNVVTFALVARLILLYLPIVAVVANAVKSIACLYKKGREDGANETEENLPGGQESSPGAVIDHSYLPFQEVSVGSLDQSAAVETSYSYREREELLAYI